MEETYSKTVDDDGSVVGVVIKQVEETVDLDALDSEIARLEGVLADKKATRAKFTTIPDPTN